MTAWHRGLLTPRQAGFVEAHLPAPLLVEDLSWNLVDTRVLHVRSGGHDVVVKAAPQPNHHIGREITAHETSTAPLVRADRTGRLVAADRDVNVLITTYLPGELVEGSGAEWVGDTYRQAGAALRLFHAQPARTDAGYELRMTQKAIALLGRRHRVDAATESTVRRILEGYRPAPAVLVPTHGDWHPRNWLQADGRLQVIDFGRFDLRPASSDLCRLATRQWRDRPELEAAFLAGYGADPRDGDVWRVELLREAVGTAVWAFLVGDAAFEAQGHRMLREAVARF